MVDTKSPADKTLSVPTKTLTLKPRVETGTVRQSFSHGRTKQVVVDKRGKRRTPGEAPATEMPASEPAAAKAAPAKAPLTRPATPAAPPRSASGVVLRTRDAEDGRGREENPGRRNGGKAIERAERGPAEARRKAEEDRHRQDEEAKRK